MWRMRKKNVELLEYQIEWKLETVSGRGSRRVEMELGIAAFCLSFGDAGTLLLKHSPYAVWLLSGAASQRKPAHHYNKSDGETNTFHPQSTHIAFFFHLPKYTTVVHRHQTPPPAPCPSCIAFPSPFYISNKISKHKKNQKRKKQQIIIFYLFASHSPRIYH